MLRVLGKQFLLIDAPLTFCRPHIEHILKEVNYRQHKDQEKELKDDVERWALGVAGVMSFFYVDITDRPEFDYKFVWTYVLPTIRRHIRERSYDQIAYLKGFIPTNTLKFSLHLKPLEDALAGINYFVAPKPRANTEAKSVEKASASKDMLQVEQFDHQPEVQQTEQIDCEISEYGSHDNNETPAGSGETALVEMASELLSAASQAATAQVNTRLIGVDTVSLAVQFSTKLTSYQSISNIRESITKNSKYVVAMRKQVSPS